MPITASVSFNVTPLPDGDVWFANAAAWNNYWANIVADIDIDPIDTILYAASVYSAGAGVYVLNIDGVEHRLVTEEMHTSLLNRLNTLNSAFETMRTELRNAGLITNAQ